MGFIELAILAARSLSVVVNNPLLGGGSSQTLHEASYLLVIFADLLEEGDEAYEELKAFTAIVKAMADEGRSPNRKERDFLVERRRITHEGYQAEKERILGEAQEETPQNPTPPPPGTEASPDPTGPATPTTEPEPEPDPTPEPEPDSVSDPEPSPTG